MKDLEDDEREFPIRVYTKVELALLYAPHLSCLLYTSDAADE